MNKSQMRSSRQSLFDDGQFIAEWLNDSGGWGYGTDSQQRAAALVLQLATLREKALKRIRMGEEERTAINEVLQHYPWVLRFARVSRDGVPLFYELAAQGPMEMIIQLARRGLLDRLRRCGHCSAWFFARTAWGTSCSTPCRQKKHRAKPEIKEKNKVYQRKYYKDILSPVTAKHLKRSKNRNANKRRTA
jgi:hypothetical protein